MIAELAGGLLEQVRRIGMLQRRRGVFMQTRRLENVSTVDQLAIQISGLPAHAHHLLGVPVVRLQLIVRHAPILHCQISRQSRRSMLFGQVRSQREKVGQKAEAHAGPMLASAAHTGARMERAVLPDGNRRSARRMAVRYGLFGDVLHHAQADVVVELVHVHRVVGQTARGAAFQRQHVQRCPGNKLLGHGETGPAAADDGDIHGFEVSHMGCQRFAIEANSILPARQAPSRRSEPPGLGQV